MFRKRKPTREKHPLLPPEIIAEVASHLSTTWDILSMCLMGKSYRTLLLPTLFASMDLKTIDRCNESLSFLNAHPERARYVRTLILRPRGNLESETFEPSLEGDIARALDPVIPHLRALHRFEWHGFDLPDDDIWAALRTHCPNLRYVTAGTRRTNRSPNESQLFQFKGLLGFTLSSISRPYAPVLPLSPMLLDMLIQRCPDLEELTFGSSMDGATSTPVYDGMPLTIGFWPNLHTLNLEQVQLFDPQAISAENTRKREQVAEFFSAHPHLRDVAMLKEYLPLDGVDLTSYRGNLGYSATFYANDMFRNLQTLDLCGTPGDGHDVIRLSSIVKILPGLVSLSFFIDLVHDFYVHFGGVKMLFRPNRHILAMIQNAPQLSHLRMVCATKYGSDFPLTDFPDVLIGSSLKSVDICRSQRLEYLRTDGCDITSAAIRLALAFPTMESISLRVTYLTPPFHNVKILRDSAYNVLHRADGLYLAVHDRVPDPWNSSGSQRYVKDLRPNVGLLSKWRRALRLRLGGAGRKEVR